MSTAKGHKFKPGDLISAINNEYGDEYQFVLILKVGVPPENDCLESTPTHYYVLVGDGLTQWGGIDWVDERYVHIDEELDDR